MPAELTAARFIERLNALQSDEELRKIRRYFKSGAGEYGEGDTFIGVRMGNIFALAKEFIDMPPDELETMLDNDIHEVRVGALSIMGKQAARKKTTPERRKELFDLYVRRTDRINNWDLVDLAAHEVVGGYLFDKPRDLLYTFARSKNLWERRIAIYSTLYFMRHGQLDDVLAIAEILVNEPEEIVQKAVGTLLRGVSSDKPRLLAFLDKHAATMPRVMLRYAVEHLDAGEKAHYMSLGKKSK